jgi:hypothetical protein
MWLLCRVFPLQILLLILFVAFELNVCLTKYVLKWVMQISQMHSCDFGHLCGLDVFWFSKFLQILCNFFFDPLKINQSHSAGYAFE